MSEIHDLLQNCLERMAMGSTLDECLTLYPQEAARLRPLLETSVQVRTARLDALEVEAAKARVRHRVEQALQILPSRTVSSYPSYTLYLRRVLTTAVAALVLFVVVGFVAEASIPGDALYGVKRFTEEVRLLVLQDEDLHQEFAKRRIDETVQLLALKRAEQVEFEGEVERVRDGIWIVSGVPVRISEDTPPVEPGTHVRVVGVTTTQGELLAIIIEAQRQETPPAEMPVVPTSTPAPMNTPAETSLSPSAPVVLPTIELVPTQLLTIVPTLVPSVCVPTHPDGWVLYTIGVGDTLSVLAISGGVSLDEITRVNCIENPGVISVGQQIYIPVLPSVETSVTLDVQPETPLPLPSIPTIMPLLDDVGGVNLDNVFDGIIGDN